MWYFLGEINGQGTDTMHQQPTSHLKATLLAMLVPAALGLAAVYVIGRGSDNRASGGSVVTPAQAQTWTQNPGTQNSGTQNPATQNPAKNAALAQASPPLPAGAGANPLSQGEMANFVFRKTPEPLPDIAYTDSTGAARTQADLKGRVILLNLWATWCVPCLKEMPGLDRLQKDLGSDKFEVVALSVDRAGPEAAKKYLDKIKIANLKLYADSTAKAAISLKAVGMPTTLLLNAQGQEIGRLIGPAEWDSEDAKKLIQAALAQ
jgi:thiol-disulfide isomerase/thioredoxin